MLFDKVIAFDNFRQKIILIVNVRLEEGDAGYHRAEMELAELRKLIEEGAATLKSLAKKIDTTRMKEPSFLMVLTGTTSYAYRREDGIYVVPIGCLKD
jgi:hypothetical protein